MNNLYTLLITSYECKGMGKTFLEESMNAILEQTYRPIQVVISDHSRDSVIKNYTDALSQTDIQIVYTKYAENYGSPCHNWNNALKYATGDYIQYLALDDKLAHPRAIQEAVEFMNATPNSNWFITAHRINPSGEVFIPKWNSNILQRNTVSGPSAIIIRSKLKDIKLDPEFIWYLDLDWYYRLYKAGGKPAVLESVHWINRKHPLQLTHTVCSQARKDLEKAYLFEKYGEPLPSSD
jgi:glycosyltransferase involved in cell wall biosynthesis